MPVIRPQHLGKNAKNPEFHPACDWPDDCTVQWGGSGIVIGGDQARLTAFFEAFPAGKGFFRGEGKTIVEAEADAFAKFSLASKCDHVWGRGFKVKKRSTEMKHGVERPKLRGETAYTNGGAICKKCKAFQVPFHSIPKLGAWRDLPSISQITMAAEGMYRQDDVPDMEPGRVKYLRQVWLKMKVAGISLPSPVDAGPFDVFANPDEDPYAVGCRKAVVDWYLENEDKFRKSDDPTMNGFFDGMARRSMTRLVEDELAYRDRTTQGAAPS